jgi:formate dehydrogenase alpha subunit
MCLVDVEGDKGLVTACTKRVQEGMVVRTQTDEVLEARRFVLELIWSTHPGDCTTCEKSGACQLQRYSYQLGIDKSRFALTREYDEDLVDRSNPLIEFDHNLCILCGRCIRICQTQGNYVLDFVKRGMSMSVTTEFERPLHEAGCYFCGSCIEVCPVGCLVEMDRKFRGREWEFEPIETVCPYCGCGCDLILDTIDDQIVRARNSTQDGYVCARGRFGWDYVLSQERLEKPLIKKNGSLTESTWDEAYEFVTERLAQIKETHGPDAMGGLISAHYPNEVLYLFQKFMRACVGTNNLDSSARFHSLPTITSFLKTLGSIDVVSPLSEIEKADVLLLVGSDIATRYPLVEVKVKEALERRAKVITIDPLNTKLAGASQLHLRPIPGSEAFLLRSIGSMMVKEGLYDEKFTSKCSNIKEFQASLKDHDEETTGVTAEDVLEVAKLYGDLNKRALIIFSAETSDLSSVLEVANLLLLTGRVEGGVVPCLPASNLQGAMDLGAMADFYPGYHAVSDPKARKMWEKAWGASLPDQAGLTALEMLQAAGSSMRGMYILGENVARSFPNTTGAEQALSALDFLVVQDIFLTETAKLADVVLPGISFAESEGTLTSVGGEIRTLRRAIKPRATPDWQTICELSSRLGLPMEYGSEAEITDEIGTIEPVRSTTKDDRTFTFHIEEPGAVGEDTDEDYPFLLMVGPTHFGYGDGVWTGQSKLSLVESAEGYVSISPEDATALGVSAGTSVKLSSRRGSTTTTIEIDNSLPQKLVFIPAHFSFGHTLTGTSPETVTPNGTSKLWAIDISVL